MAVVVISFQLLRFQFKNHPHNSAFKVHGRLPRSRRSVPGWTAPIVKLFCSRESVIPSPCHPQSCPGTPSVVHALLFCQSTPGIGIVWLSLHNSITRSPQDRVCRPVTPPGGDGFTGPSVVGSRTRRHTPGMDVLPTRTSTGRQSCAGHGVTARGRAANKAEIRPPLSGVLGTF